MDSKQTLVAFGGLALVGFHFWTGPQKPSLSVLWGAAPPTDPKGTLHAILPPDLFGITPKSTPSDPTLGGILPAPAPSIAPGQKPSTLPYGPNSAGRM